MHITAHEAAADDWTSVRLSQESAARAEKEGKSDAQITDNEGDPQLSSPLSHLRPFGAIAHTGRPVMAAVLRELVRQGESTMVVGCGPDTFRVDLANAVAAEQSRVLRGEVVEFAMHLEKFGL